MTSRPRTTKCGLSRDLVIVGGAQISHLFYMHQINAHEKFKAIPGNYLQQGGVEGESEKVTRLWPRAPRPQCRTEPCNDLSRCRHSTSRLRDTEQVIACPILHGHDDAGVDTRLLRVVHNPPRLVV